MEKPVTVSMNELKNELINTINKFKLHIAIVKPIVNEINLIIDQEYIRVTQEELKLYEENKMSEEQEE